MEVVKNFFDLCVMEECVNSVLYEKTIKRLYQMGYHTIAVNQVVDDSNMEPKKKRKKGESKEIVDVVPPPLKFDAVEGCEDLKILNRLTIVFENQDIIHKIVSFIQAGDRWRKSVQVTGTRKNLIPKGNSVQISSAVIQLIKSPNYKKYNIIAAMPTSQQALQFTCSTMEADIFSYNPESKATYTLSRKLYFQIVKKGFYFEILYAPTINDSSKRKHMIAMSHLYHANGKSKNVIVSSGATNPFLLRSPYDIIAMGILFGLNEENSKNSISHFGRNVFLHSVGRRNAKGIVLVENIKDIEEDTKSERDSGNEEMDKSEQPPKKRCKLVS